MPSWEEMKTQAGRIYGAIYNDIGSTYQQVLQGGTGAYQGNYTPQPQQIAAAYDQVNPEYRDMERAYAAQETERERLDSITVADYKATNIDYVAYGRDTEASQRYIIYTSNPNYQPTAADWKEYGQYLDEYEAANPSPDPQPAHLEPER